MFETFFGPDGFNSLWTWLRAELQGRGVHHGHGCLHLKADPGFNTLALAVFKGRQAQHFANEHGVALDVFFPVENIQDDEWVSVLDDEAMDEDDVEVDEEIVEQVKRDVELSVQAEKMLICFQTLLINMMHPDPPSDAEAESRDEATEFVQEDDNIHPSACDARDLTWHDGPLLDTIEWHKHQACCLEAAQKKRMREQQHRSSTNAGSGAGSDAGSGANSGSSASNDQSAPEIQNKDCRFDCPMDICDVCHIVVKEHVIKRRDGTKEKCVKLEIKPRRNDRWLNSHNAVIMRVWHANIDMQLMIDLGKVVGCMTKHVTKSEASTTKGAQKMMSRLLTRCLDDGNSVQCTLRKTMGKLMGNRTLFKQEIFHLIMSIPAIFCSHTFVKVNLDNDVERLLLASSENENNDNGNNDNDDEQDESSRRAMKMSLSDAHRNCTDHEQWLKEEEHDAVKNDLPNLAFRQFAAMCSVGERQSHRNKIKLRPKNNVVIKFCPNFSSNPSSPTCTTHCKHALLKRAPWAGQDPSVLWGGEEAMDDDVRQAWAMHLESHRAQGSPAPDFIRKEIEDYHNDPSFARNEPMLQDPLDPDDLEETEYNMNLPEEEIRDPDEVDIEWDRDHDWSEPEHDCDPSVLENAPQNHKNMIDDFVQTVDEVTEEDVNLNELQQLGREMLLDLVEEEDAENKSGTLIGKGGTGKSTMINAALCEAQQKHGVKSIIKFAMTGMAATVIGTSALHSSKHGLGLPVSRQKFKELSGDRLVRLQTRFANVKLIIIDECSMLRSKELYFIDQFLHQISGKDELFGGFAVLLVGDPAQIPAALGKTLWDSSAKTEHDKFGQMIHKGFFKKVVELLDVARVATDQGDETVTGAPTREEFLAILD